MHSLFDIKNKKAIVTGGSRGLGYGISEGLLESGCEVVIIGSSDKVFESVNNWKNQGYKCYGVKADLSKKEENKRAFWECMNYLNNDIDIFVCGAGVISRHPAEKFPMDEWENTIDVNLNSTFIMCQLASEIMIKKRYGKIINIASMCSYFGGQTVAAYSATKGAVMQLTKALSNDWAKFGINVNAIAPGYMSTDMTEGIRVNPDRYEEITKRIPLGRWGNPDDLKGCAIFLSSGASDYLCGAIIPVDGGYLVK